MQVYDACSYYPLVGCAGTVFALHGDVNELEPYVGQYVSVRTRIGICGSNIAGDPIYAPVVDQIQVIENPCCPATVALGEESTESNLQTLRQFRDEVLAASPSSHKYIDLYYQHSAEVAQILLSDAGLRSRTARLLREFMPGIRGLLDEAGAGEMVLTPARIRQIENLLDEYSGQASPELRSAIEEMRKQLKHLEGKTLREAWQSMTTTKAGSE